MTKEELTEEVRFVARARVDNEAAQALKAQAYEEWLAANIELFQNAESTATILALAESLLKEMAVEYFNEQAAIGLADKSPVPGVGIRVVEELVYLDADALFWAKEHGLALKPEALDKREFEKLARVTVIPFVVATPVPHATIAAKLPEVVEDSDDPA